jgi:4-carboxymuconolactone decarboxylase
MVGYPRVLVAFGLWRKASRIAAPPADADADYSQAAEWTTRGEATCGVVYGANYGRLRENVRDLHPALDLWMITEGYGRTMSRPGLDLMRRELCTVAQTAVLEVPRQLHSHLRGALHAGATFGQVEGVLSVVNPLLSYDQWKQVKELWTSVRDAWEPEE